jgi:hypothetical protein
MEATPILLNGSRSPHRAAAVLSLKMTIATSPIATAGSIVPIAMGLQLRQNDLRDHFRWKTVAAGIVQAGVDSAHLRDIVGWSMPL